MAKRYDVIIVGGGHNGLTCGAYLARAGVKVLVLERRHIVGGPCAEYEYFPGFRASITNSPGSLEPKVVADLELERFGLQFTRPDPTLMFPFPDGRCFVAWRDKEKVVAELSKFSKNDATNYYKLFEFLNAFAARLGISLFEPPVSIGELISRLKTSDDEETFAKLFFGSAKDLLDEYLESGEIKAVVAQLAYLSNQVGPMSPGSCNMLLMRPMSLASSSIDAEHDPRKQYLRGSTGLPLGGMGSVVRTMRDSLEEAGGTVRTECAVTRIIVKDGRVIGVALDDGEEIEADMVTSNINPRLTYLDLIEAEHLDPGFRQKVENLPDTGNAFKVALALDDLPYFAAAPKGMEELCSSCQFRIAPSMEYQEKAVDDFKYGRPSEKPCYWGLISSTADPKLAPPGKHVMSLNMFHAPRDLAEGSWDTERDRFGNRIIDILDEYMPGLKDKIIDARFWSPLDLEQEFGLLGGNIAHIDMTPRYMFGLRPMHELADYRSPIEGLYSCGSNVWPGGTVTGIPGHNASQTILKDRTRDRTRLVS